jgi:hypothetical protein
VRCTDSLSTATLPAASNAGASTNAYRRSRSSLALEAGIDIDLPDATAQAAREAGLLPPQVLEQLLREAMRKRQVDRFFAAMGKPAALEPPMTEAKIAAARAERARRR